MRSLLLVSLFLPSLAFAAGPLETIRQKNGEVDKLIKQKADPDPNSAAEKKRQDEIKKLAGSLLDYGELARQSLGAEWNKLTDKQRTDFSAVLESVIEKRYVGQLKTNVDYEVKYKPEVINGDKATVASAVKVKTAGKSTTVDMVYKLAKKSDRWMVIDIVTDESSLVREYNQQFSKIINDKGYDELYRRMQKLAQNGT